MKTIAHVNAENFDEVVKNNKGAVLVDFFAVWCGPCKMLSPILEQVNNDLENITIAKVDIDEALPLAKKFGIMSVPTMILFVKGEEKERLIGLRQKSQIIETVKKYID